MNERIEYATVARGERDTTYDLVKALKQRVATRANAIKMRIQQAENEKSHKGQD